MTRLRVLVLDGQTLFRDGISLLIERGAGMALVGRLADDLSALELVEREQPDVVLGVVRSPRDPMLRTVMQVLALLPQPRMVVLADPDGELVENLLPAGVKGYIPLESAPQQMIEAVRAVGMGCMVIAPDVTALFIERYREMANGQTVENRCPLNERELAVLQWLANGHTNAQIADELFLSRNTVNRALLRTYRKLGVESRTEAVAIAVRRGLIQKYL